MVPAPALLMLSGVSNYLGAAVAVNLFPHTTPVAASFFRLGFTGIILLAWRRPWHLTWKDYGIGVVFGIATAIMNTLFYESIARIPVGTSVSVEFIGPIMVAVFGARGWASWLAIVLAGAGVVSIGGFGLDVTDPVQLAGMLYTLGAAVGWAAYIVLGRLVATTTHGLDSLAIATFSGALLMTPLAVEGAVPVVQDPYLLFMAFGVAVLSSLFPFVIDQIAMARVSAATFALLTALLPVTSVLIGIFTLGQVPSFAEVMGMIMVSIAVALAMYGSSPHKPLREQIKNFPRPKRKPKNQDSE